MSSSSISSVSLASAAPPGGPSFVSFLKLLDYMQTCADADAASGCQSASFKFDLTDDLFQLPNREAFHRVIRFLFATIDAERCNAEFRDCWPILEKKQESEFRRKAFLWYKELQSCHPDLLCNITASLFQSPGGRKFLSFISQFTRFVVLYKLQRDSALDPESEPILQLTPASLHSLAPAVTDVLPFMMADNLTAARCHYAALLDKHARAQSLADKVSATFIRFKSEAKSLAEDLDSSAARARALLKLEPSVPLEETIRRLDEACQTLKQDQDDLRPRLHSELDKQIALVQSMAEVIKSSDHAAEHSGKKRQVLDLNEFKGKLGSMEQVLERHIDCVLRLVQQKPVMRQLPTADKLAACSQVVSNHRGKYDRMNHELDDRLIPGLVEKIRQHKAQLRGVIWKSVFPHFGCGASTDFEPAEDEQFVIPPLPDIVIESVNESDSNSNGQVEAAFILQQQAGVDHCQEARTHHKPSTASSSLIRDTRMGPISEKKVQRRISELIQTLNKFSLIDEESADCSHLSIPDLPDL